MIKECVNVVLDPQNNVDKHWDGKLEVPDSMDEQKCHWRDRLILRQKTFLEETESVCKISRSIEKYCGGAIFH